MRPHTRIRRIDGEGISLQTVGDQPLDVLFDDRRVWTFWTLRDTESTAGRLPSPLRTIAWPRPLLRYLDGFAHIAVRTSVGSRELAGTRVQFGSGTGAVQVRNDDGVELGFDKSGKLVPTFAGRSQGDIDSLLDVATAAIDALRGAGLEPFLAYGTLLGAVREGRVLPHDSDADLGYVSRHTTPVDVTRESFQVQRALARQGWSIQRYSGAAFKMSVTEAEAIRGLDVFGGFFDRRRLYLMGEIGVDFDPAWIRPLGTAELSGRPMPVPANSEALLEATYGPGWRVPDPAFQFETPARTVRALDDWFRGTQPGLRWWARRVHALKHKPLRSPSSLAYAAARRARELGDAQVLDIGAAAGADSVWLAGQGFSVRAYDFVPEAMGRAERKAREDGLDLETTYLNLTEWRSVLAEGAALAHDPRPRVIVARHVFEATSSEGRLMLARLCSMALRTGGALLAEVITIERREPGTGPDWLVGQLDVDVLLANLRRAGARELTVTDVDDARYPSIRILGEW